MPGSHASHRTTADQTLHCPLYTAAPVVPCDPAELEPLLVFLRRGVPVSVPLSFPRGTIMDDGRLDLCKQALGPRGCRMVIDAMAGNRSIASLLLGTDGIGNTGAADVARLVDCNPAVEVLYLGCNRIDAQGIAPLAASVAASASVVGLWLKRNPVGPEGARRLAEMLRTTRTLRTLDLVNTRIGLEGLEVLTDALTRSNQTIERLYLGGNFFGTDEAPYLARLLCGAPRLKALMLNVGFLGDDGAAVLAEALAGSPDLKELGLASNGIGPDGGALLLAAADAHPSLTHLDLGYSISTRALGAMANRLGDIGAAHAAHCLARNPVLRRLDLRGNGFTSQGLNLLAGAMEHNTRLCSLPLDGRPHEVILQRLERNRRSTSGEEEYLYRDVALTQSVYRTA